MPTSVLSSQAPFENLFNKPPLYSLLRVFGCLCFPHVRHFNKHKFDYISRPCVFIGHSSTHLCYKCTDKIGRVNISRHVQFEELVFPLYTKQCATNISFYTTNSTSGIPLSSVLLRNSDISSSLLHVNIDSFVGVETSNSSSTEHNNVLSSRSKSHVDALDHQIVPTIVHYHECPPRSDRSSSHLPSEPPSISDIPLYTNDIPTSTLDKIDVVVGLKGPTTAINAVPTC